MKTAKSRFYRVSTTPTLEEYKERFKDCLIFERKNGILLARMHTNGGPVKWSPVVHHMLQDAWTVIGQDPENEVFILTSTDPYWIGEKDGKTFDEYENDPDTQVQYQTIYRATRSVEHLLWCFDIPTIAAINGPGALHINFALFCDITLCTPDFTLHDIHYPMGFVPGDSVGLCLQALTGIKRGAYMMYMANVIDAKTALELGVVNEILPKKKLLPRAWEIAETIMKVPRPVRRMTHALTVRPWKRVVMEDYGYHLVSECYNLVLNKSSHDFEDKQVQEGWYYRKTQERKK